MPSFTMDGTTIFSKSGSDITYASGNLTNALADSNTTYPAGHIVDIKTAVYRGIQSTSTSTYTQIGYGEHDVLEVTTATPQSSSSKFFLVASIGCIGQSGSSTGTIAFKFTRGGTFISESGSDHTSGSRIATSARYAVASYSDQNHGGGMSFSYLDSPASASASVYSILYNTQNSREGTINRASGYLDDALTYGSLTASSLTVFEIAG